MGKIAIFAGHNSVGDNGANGLLFEDNVTKEAMLLAVDYAQRCGHTVVGGASALGQGINQRCAIANNGGAQGIIEFHGNSGGGIGGETYYDARSNESANLAVATINSATGGGMANKRGAKPDTATRFGSLGILRGTAMPGVLHELFFLDTAGDVAIWNASKKVLVESIMKGFLQGLSLITVPIYNEGNTSDPSPIAPSNPPLSGKYARSYNETGTMFATERNWVKDIPTKAAPIVEWQEVNQSIKYHKVLWNDGLVWLQLTGWDGKERYVAYADASAGNGFGRKYGYCK
ncbi:N-acetylmuramoyl-L-alanine amidase [Carnobacterium maltaromaticum]|uniref:N-acetylmuramoyl-L-alanine amidase n=1 Tax=Carnobacterium maltaromaticum TaxID=2751 RepID=UPI001E4F40C5|nr:N-acetylmuramoyl-L-alanine amidase [Carnobacterium maltaromaticum]